MPTPCPRIRTARAHTSKDICSAKSSVKFRYSAFLQLQETRSTHDTSPVPHDTDEWRRSAEISTASPLFLPFNELEQNRVAPVFELNNTTRRCVKHGVVLVILLVRCVLATRRSQPTCEGREFMFDYPHQGMGAERRGHAGGWLLPPTIC